MKKANPEEIIGKRFGHLRILLVPLLPKRKAGRSLVLCDCNTFKIVKTSNVKSGNTKSCGCKRIKPGDQNNLYKHGMTNSPTYTTWRRMKDV